MTFWQWFLCRALIQLMLPLTIVPSTLGLRVSHILGIPSEVLNNNVACPTRMIRLLDSHALHSMADLSMRVELGYFHARKTPWTTDASVLGAAGGKVGKC